jgi:hypothetical protein
MIHKSILLSALLLAPCLAQAEGWEPSPGHLQVPIWPGAVPNAIHDPQPETADPDGGVTNVSRPTITMYAAKGRNTEVAMVVFPASLEPRGSSRPIAALTPKRGIHAPQTTLRLVSFAVLAISWTS